MITQNVDNLHQDAGVPDDKITEIHGNARIRWKFGKSIEMRGNHWILWKLWKSIEIRDFGACAYFRHTLGTLEFHFHLSKPIFK